MAWVVALIFISSAFGMVASNLSASKIRYNDHVLKIRENSYVLEVDKAEIDFYSSPEAVDDIELSDDFVNVLFCKCVKEY